MYIFCFTKTTLVHLYDSRLHIAPHSLLPRAVVVLHQPIQGAPIFTHMRRPHPFSLDVSVLEIAGFKREVGAAKNALTQVGQAVFQVGVTGVRRVAEAHVENAEAVQFVEHDYDEQPVLWAEADEAVAGRGHAVPLSIRLETEDREVHALLYRQQDIGEVGVREGDWIIVTKIGYATVNAGGMLKRKKITHCV